MIERLPREALVDLLVADLKPVRRLWTPGTRTAAWLAVVLAIAVALASVSDLPAIGRRLGAASDMWLAVSGSTLTSALAALAAFELNLPDRSRWWALLPLPGLALWIGASGMGCARTWLIAGLGQPLWSGLGDCLPFIVGLSLPLSMLTVAMLRRGYSMSPTLTGTVAGLAVAAAAATLLNFFHPFDAALDDLLVHALAVGIVVAANRAVGGRLLSGGRHAYRAGGVTRPTPRTNG